MALFLLGTCQIRAGHRPVANANSVNLQASCLSLRPPSALCLQLHGTAMRLLVRLEGERKSGAIWDGNLQQSPKRHQRHQTRTNSWSYPDV